MSAKLQSYIPAQIKLQVTTPGFEALEFQKMKNRYLKTPEVLKFGFGRDVLPRTLKVDPYKYQCFSRKSDPFMYQSAQFGAKFWAKSQDFSKILLKSKPILAQV